MGSPSGPCSFGLIACSMKKEKSEKRDWRINSEGKSRKRPSAAFVHGFLASEFTFHVLSRSNLGNDSADRAPTSRLSSLRNHVADRATADLRHAALWRA